MISLRDVRKRFPSSTSDAVQGLTLDIAAGELVTLIGPSGCGKTTTLKMINRLIEPTAGVIEVAGQNVMDQDPVSLRRGIGYVIQNVGLMPHRTVRDNVATVPNLLGWGGSRIGERIDELLELFHLEPALLERYPAELSGGQRQRVGVARALAADPPVMLMDEPFGAVDPIVRGRLQDEFLRIQAKLRKTVVLVTHDIDEAIKMSDRMAVLNIGGKLEQFAPPEEVLREPSGDFVTSFIGAERGLKRLSLARVASLNPERGPTVQISDPSAYAQRVIANSSFDWTTVLDGERLVGWVDRDALGRTLTVHDASIRPFKVQTTPESTLRQALDAIVTSRTGVAVVVEDGDRYSGILTLEGISREIVS